MYRAALSIATIDIMKIIVAPPATAIRKLLLAETIDFVAAISKPSSEKEKRAGGFDKCQGTSGGSLKNVFHRQSVNRILPGDERLVPRSMIIL